MKLSYGQCFQQTVLDYRVRHQTFNGIIRPVDLKRIRATLYTSAHLSIEMLRTDFDQIERNARVWNDVDYQRTMDARTIEFTTFKSTSSACWGNVIDYYLQA